MKSASNLVIAFLFIMAPLWLLLSHIGAIVGFPLVLVTNLWLLIGALVIRTRGLKPPLPKADSVDLPGMLSLIWWAAWWPRYIGNQRK